MSTETLVIADLHLRAQAPEVTQRLLALEPRLLRASALYILGDLVEAWLGDDAPPDPAITPAFDMLARLASAGIPIHLQHGNRDFLIGRRLANRLGLTLLPEVHVASFYGHRTLLIHGDQLCTDDLAYQRMRQILRHPLVRFILPRLPLRTRRVLADGLRKKSQQDTGRKAAAIMDVNQGAVEGMMRRFGTSVLIHGHTHRPALHHEPLGLRAVLGDWEQGACLLSLHRGGLKLERIDDDGCAEILTESPWPVGALT